MRALIRFLAALPLLAAASHLACSSLSAFVMSWSYDDRMPNVRLFDSEPRAKQSLIAAYLRSAAGDGGPVTCFVGSSFTWGYPLKDDAALATAAGESIADSRSINASIIGAGLEVTRNTLEIAREQNLRFARVVVEIPVVNELACLESGCSWSNFCLPARPEPFAREVRYSGSYFRWFLTTPGGWRRVPDLVGDDGDECDDRPVQLGKLPEKYFLSRERFAVVREAYRRSIAATLDVAAQVADEVVVFPSPIYVDGAASLGFDAEALHEQVDFTLEVCRHADGGAVAVELEERHLSDPRLFANVTHFNGRGNREFGRWLAAKIEAGRAQEPVRTAGAPGPVERR